MTYPLLFSLLLMLTGSCQNNDDMPDNPADALPPATQTGEQVLACLIDGEPFIADRFGSGQVRGFYQFIENKYTLGINGSTGNGNALKSINLSGIEIPPISEGDYLLTDQGVGNFDAVYSIAGGIILEGRTSNEEQGQLTITRFDEQEFIISGTFEFTVYDNDGSEIKVTDGRFDIHYTN